MRKRSIVLLCMMLLYTQMAAYGQTFNSNQITDYTNGNDAYVTSGNALKVDVASSSGTANVNVFQVGGSSTATGNGIAGTGGVQRVTIASDSTGQLTLAAGANLIGSVSQSGVWNIGSVTTITNPVAVTGTFWQATQPVSGTFWQATQPVSGTVAATQSGTWNIGTVTTLTGITNPVAVTGTFWQATQPVSLASVPTHAVTESGTWSVKLLDTGGTNLASISAAGAVKVDGSAVTQPVSGTFWQATQPVSGTFWQATQPVSLASVPTHAVTQSGTWNIGTVTTLTSLDLAQGSTTSGQTGPLVQTATTTAAPTYTTAKTNPLSTTTAGALRVDGSGVTQPVSGTFWQATQPVSGTFWQATQPVSGTVTANIGTSGSLALDATLTGGTQKTKIVDTAGTNVATVSAAGAVKVDGSAVTQPVSGTFWQATQPVSGTLTGITNVVHVDDNAGSLTVDGTFWQATQPVSLASVPTHAVTESGTWTVQPGNTANTTPWLATISQGGNSATVDATGALKVAATVTVGDNKNEDAQHTSGDAGSFLLTVRNDLNATLTSGNGDYSPISVNNSGAPRAEILIPSGYNFVKFTTATQYPTYTCQGTDGNIYASNSAGNTVCKMNPLTGAITEYTIPTAACAPQGICQGSDGNIYGVESAGNKVFKMTTAGSFTEFTITTAAAQPQRICQGADGNLYGTEYNTNKVFKMTTAGVFTEFTIPTASSLPLGICQGSDGNMYGCESAAAASKVFKMTTAGVFTEYATTSLNSLPKGICQGLDGNLYGIEFAGPKLFKMTTGGVFTEYSITNGGDNISQGSDGTLYSGAQNGTTLYPVLITMTTTGGSASYNIYTTAGDVASGTVTVGTDGNLYGGSQGGLWKACTGYATVTSTNPFPVTTTLGAGSAVIGALTANQSVNCSQMNGVAVTMGNGVSGTGVQRVTLASDSTGQVTLAAGAATIGALTANQSVNISQMNGVATTMGNGVSGTGVQRVTIASDSTGIVALTTGSAQIGHLEANQSSNIAQINGVTPLMGNGATGTGALRVSIANDSTGIVALTTGTASIGKISDITTSMVPGTGATNLGKAEDAGHTSGDTGSFILGVRNDANAAFSGTDLDYTPIATTSAGAVKVVEETTGKTTYFGTTVGDVVCAALATDVITLTGSATKTVKVLRIKLYMGETTAGVEDVYLVKRSTADSSGTSTTITAVAADSNNAGATATMKAYTVNPTTGTLVGNIIAARVEFPLKTTPLQPPFYDFFNAHVQGQPITLRGTGEVLAINLNGITVTGGVLRAEIEWTEE